MFPSFIGILDIQSWWEVPSIAYFCSLFRTAFNLLDFDIEELEEALLTDGTEESASSLLTELIVRLLNGCLGNNDISAFNYQMYLRRLFRRKCQDTRRCNPFDSDIDFQFLPLRTKVEILYALCDFRLDADDVFDLFKNLEAESLRVEPLGWDDNDSAYWYFYGTRLYREDILKKPKGKTKKKKSRESKKRGWFYGDDWFNDDNTERIWQVVCFTEEDWTHLTEKFSKATSKVEKELYRSLSQNFLPEIPRLFQEKERLQRKRLLELAPRRTSSRVLQKIKQKEEETKQSSHDSRGEEDERKETPHLARENRARRRNLLRSKSASSDSCESSEGERAEMPQNLLKRSKSTDNKRSKNSTATQKEEPPPEPPVKTGRKTNNSLASATGQIVIPDNDEPVSSTRKKLKTSQIFGQTEEDVQTDMYKILEQLTNHEDAWPFIDPVEEEYAPNYYAVIRRPMDLRKMEERLDSGYYTDFSMFKADFKLIVNNCRLYNGQDNEYTVMVDKLQAAFDRLTEKYMHRLSSSDEEIAVEYQLPTPSRKHKLKSSESPTGHKRKKRKSHSDATEPKASSSDPDPGVEVKAEEGIPENEAGKSKESHKSKQGKDKKKRKGHHRHGKHSKNHKKNSSKSKHGKKHGKHKDKEGKRKKKKNKHHEVPLEPKPEPQPEAEPLPEPEPEPEPELPVETLRRSASQESLESSNRSRSASPLPSIHTPSPSPTDELQAAPPTPPPRPDSDLYKDKFDKIKERRRQSARDAFEALVELRRRAELNRQKQNLSVPDKEKNKKLRETIEKLKAKNEKYNETSLFNSLFNTQDEKDDDGKDSSNESNDAESTGKRETPTESTRGPNEKPNATEGRNTHIALEKAVKDISMWLDVTPTGTADNSPCNSPAQTISTEDHDNSRQDDDFPPGDKPTHSRKEVSRKRPSSREPKLIKRREIQRTIDRLQPGKSKGNLLTNKSTEKSDEGSPGPLTKAREATREESSPKLSLGSVLPTVEFTLGKDLNFSKDEDKVENKKDTAKKTSVEKVDKMEEAVSEKKPDEVKVQPNKRDVEIETDPITPPGKPSQEKATPNLSAWFKAFGTPKSTTSTVTTSKKKVEVPEVEEKATENTKSDNKSVSPKNTGIAKYDSPTDPETPNPDGGDSPLPNVSTSRQRRTSTGSSVSERSSFSQDLDSPRNQLSHTSPLLRSPASPRTDDFQKITYPIINGSVRAGFYQDTTSMKSSPEKSCSPREAGLQSPYSSYSQHVYASNNVMGSATPNYFVDQNKSPLPAYGANLTSYYDNMKSPSLNKSRTQEDYTLGADTYQQNQYSSPYSPVQSPYSQQQSVSYSQMKQSPQSPASDSPISLSVPTTPQTPLPLLPPLADKNTLFPVKKRSYNEPDTLSAKKVAESKENAGTVPLKNDYQKSQTHSSLSTQSVDDIALALSEKSEMAKLNSLRENERRHAAENRDHHYNKESKQDSASADLNKPIGMVTKDNIDMVNMGYMNSEMDRKNNTEMHETDYGMARDIQKSNVSAHQPKTYDVDAIAINLGMNSHQMQKALSKPMTPTNIPPAHSHDRHSEVNLTHAHHAQYDTLSGGQSISNFSLNDIELANKKLYACNTAPSSVAIDYGNWKMSNQIRKQDLLPSDYSNVYSTNAEKLKADNATAINYNKNVQHQQYSNYNVPRSSMQRNQELQQNLHSELRIPNPRGLLKNDNPTSVSDTDLIAKTMDSLAKSQKPEKMVQNHPLIGSIPYKTPYSTHSSLPLDSLRNLPNIPQMLERYTNDERYLSSFASSSSALYHDKTFQMAQMFNKSMPSDVHAASQSVYSQPSPVISKENPIYKASSSIATAPVESKPKPKRKRTSDTKQMSMAASQSYHTPSSADVLSSVKTSMMPGSAFSFGTSANMGLGSGLYGDNAGFTIEDFRNSTANQLMAANYMAAAVAHQQRNNVESNAEKIAKPAHQNSSHSSASFPFMGHGQVRGGYGFESSSPLYQQYLQRHQEELLRQTGAQMMGLYPPGYPAALPVRQPYDAINRPSWL